MHLRRLLSFVAALIITAGVITFAAAPAQAASSDCTAGRVCVWYNNGTFAGSPNYYWTVSTSQCIPLAGSANDRVLAIVNNAGWIATLYKDAGCSGPVINTTSRYGSAGKLGSCTNNYSYWNVWESACFAPTASSIWFVP